MNDTAPVQKQDIDSIRYSLDRIRELLEEFLELARKASKEGE